MKFWDRVETEIVSQRTTYRWLSGKINKAETTVSGWRRLGRLPRVDEAVAIAAALGVTVEYLVSGENQISWKPPIRLARIVDDLLALDDPDLNAVSVLAHGLAEASKVRQDSARTG